MTGITGIRGDGWELLIERLGQQERHRGRHRVRTVGTYQVFHDGTPQAAPDLVGTTAEQRGPGDNGPTGKSRQRIQAGRYPLATWGGTRYATHGFASGNVTSRLPRPALAVGDTGARTEILIHPGQAWLSSVGCINLSDGLTGAEATIRYKTSRRRVLAVIADLAAYLADDFPRQNGRQIPRAHLVILGEP